MFVQMPVSGLLSTPAGEAALPILHTTAPVAAQKLHLVGAGPRASNAPIPSQRAKRPLRCFRRGRSRRSRSER